MPDKSAQLEKTKQLLAELPVPNRTLLGWLFVHMSHVMEKVGVYQVFNVTSVDKCSMAYISSALK